MANYTASIEKLIESLIKLPGVGRRSAERIVAHVLGASNEEIKILSESLYKVKKSVRSCQICNNLSEEDTCKICQDLSRQKDIVCVVEKPSDVTAIEKAGNFHGSYHVLLGSISPLEGRGPSDLKIDGLIQRIKQGSLKDTEGETTAMYLTQLLKPLGVHLSRIGLGIPVGSNLEYADATTLSKSLESRRTI
jgi:recombination protein RecR